SRSAGPKPPPPARRRSASALPPAALPSCSWLLLRAMVIVEWVGCRVTSSHDDGGQLLEVVGRGAVRLLQREQAFVEQVGVVLPRVADAAQHLDGAGADPEEGVAGVGLGHGGGPVQLAG